MRSPIWLRILITVDLLVIAGALAIGWFSSEIAGKVVEDRLIQETARRTGEFLSSQNLPFSNTLMGYLRRMHGAHFVTLRVPDGAVMGSSLPPETAEQLRAVAKTLGPAGSLELGGVLYRYESHQIRVQPTPDRRDAEIIRLYAFVPKEEFQAARALTSRRIAEVTLPVLAAATVLAIVLAFPLARPLRRLAARMEAIDTGNPDVRAGLAAADGPGRRDGLDRYPGPLEVAKLAGSFDRLMVRLAEAQGRLAHHERLATLGRVAASVVHELRNPLSGIRMNLRVLQDEMEDRQLRSESLEASLREIERMGLYLDELSDLAAGAARSGEPLPLRWDSMTPVRLDDLVHSTLAVFQGRCRHAGVQVRENLDPTLPQIRGDAERLRQVLINLIVNALEAMPSGGTLDISVQAAGNDKVRCTVADTGEGIRADGIESLFEPFVTTKSHSVGLGLYVSRRIIEAHGGAIGAHNGERGAVFWFEIPLSPRAEKSQGAGGSAGGETGRGE